MANYYVETIALEGGIDAPVRVGFFRYSRTKIMQPGFYQTQGITEASAHRIKGLMKRLMKEGRWHVRETACNSDKLSCLFWISRTPQELKSVHDNPEG